MERNRKVGSIVPRFQNVDYRNPLTDDDLPEVFTVRIRAPADSIPRRIRTKRWLKNALHYNLRAEVIAPEVIDTKTPTTPR